MMVLPKFPLLLKQGSINIDYRRYEEFREWKKEMVTALQQLFDEAQKDRELHAIDSYADGRFMGKQEAYKEVLETLK